MFCLGRHVIRDLSTCARGAALPAAIITVGNPTQSGGRSPAPTRSPAIEPQPLSVQEPEQPVAREPAITPAPLPAPLIVPQQTPVAPRPELTPTQRLNAGPNG